MRRIIQAVAVAIASTVAAVVMHHILHTPVVPVAAIGFVIGLVA